MVARAILGKPELKPDEEFDPTPEQERDLKLALVVTSIVAKRFSKRALRRRKAELEALTKKLSNDGGNQMTNTGTGTTGTGTTATPTTGTAGATGTTGTPPPTLAISDLVTELPLADTEFVIFSRFFREQVVQSNDIVVKPEVTITADQYNQSIDGWPEYKRKYDELVAASSPTTSSGDDDEDFVDRLKQFRGIMMVITLVISGILMIAYFFGSVPGGAIVLFLITLSLLANASNLYWFIGGK